MPMLEALHRMPATTSKVLLRDMAKVAMLEAIAAGTFQLSEVLSTPQPIRDRCMEVLTDRWQERLTVNSQSYGIGDNIRIFVRVAAAETGRKPTITRSKERIEFRGEHREGEKLLREFPPGLYALSRRDAVSMLLKHGVGVCDRRGTRGGIRNACVTEVGYEYDGRRYNTEHLAKRPTTVVANRVEQAVQQAVPLPPPGESDASMTALPPPVTQPAEKPRKQAAA